MHRQRRLLQSAALAAATMILLPALARADADFDELQEKAIKAAAQKVAPCVVQIETSGGTEIVRTGPQGMIRRGVGPTSGLIVSADGYVISSAFNFANKPAQIRVAVPGHKERYVAQVVANDQMCMLTLLKLLGVQGKLPVPAAAPRHDVKVGHTAIALGRTLAASDRPPSVSVGIISAIDRIWGRALQTDAKISPTNYGGPLVDLYGRVMGVLVPASPRAEGETAGFEWYDSGIGFAIPLEDINRVLPRMLKGTEKNPVTLRRGLLGITLKSQDAYSDPPTIGSIAPGSLAEKIHLKEGDVIKEIDGQPVRSQSQMMHRLGRKYEGDEVTFKVQRGTKEIKHERVALAGVLTAFARPFLGVLPLRDDSERGVQVRYVYPRSPAEKAGLKVGDRLLKIGPSAGPPQAMRPIAGRDDLLALLHTATPGSDARFEVKRKGGKTDTLTIKLTEVPDAIPEALPEGSAWLIKKDEKKPPRPNKKDDKKDDKDKKDADKAEPKTGLIRRTTAARDHNYWIYVPENYDPKVAHALVVWLHPPNKNKNKDVDDFTFSWQLLCEGYHMILVGPLTESDRGWTQGEVEVVQEAMKDVLDHYTIDRQRIVAHGLGVGGEMAFYLGFHVRNLIRGVAAVGATLSSNPRDKVLNQPLSFYLVAGGKDPLCPAIKETKAKLDEKKYPVIYREVELMGHQYIDGQLGIPTLEELGRWIDTLDLL